MEPQHSYRLRRIPLTLQDHAVPDWSLQEMKMINSLEWWFSLVSIAFAALCFIFIFSVWHKEIRIALMNSGHKEINHDLQQRVLDEHALDSMQRKALQNAVYKRWGFALITLGLFGGFAPSITKALIHHHVWDVGTDQPHSDVDSWLYAHIGGALIWGMCIMQQLVSGGSSVSWQQKWHRISGWLAVISLLIGVSLSGGLIWTIHYDFFVAESFNVGAGLYTIILALSAALNMLLAVRYARSGQFALHKDHALMAIMWTMDPAVHRSVMWLLHLACYSCFTPAAFEGTQQSLNVIAKMPANVLLFSWCLCIAIHARRMNTILLLNGSGQYALWTLQIMNALSAVSWVAAICVFVVLCCIYAGLVIKVRRSPL